MTAVELDAPASDDTKRPPLRILTDREKALAVLLMDESGIDIAEFAFKDYENPNKTRCYRVRPYQWRWWRCPDDHQIDACVAAGQTITTLDGPVKVEDVTPGTMVLTHMDRFQMVTAVVDNGVLPVVKVHTSSRSVVVTSNHEFRTNRGWSCPDQWVGLIFPAINVDGAWERVTHVERAGSTVVYDMIVDTDESFVVEGIQVHNCGRSVGKALALDTPIPTATGWSTMGDIKVGDQVFDEMGRPCSVTAAYDVLVDRPCYELSFDDGSSIVADAEHQWRTTDSWGSTRVRTTSSIAASLTNNVGHRITGPNRAWFPAPHNADTSSFGPVNVDVQSVRPVPSVPVRCIEVDSQSHLFLAGPTMIPTHNSERVKARTAAFGFNRPGQEMVLVAPQGKHVDAITQRIEPEFANTRLLREMLIGGSTSNGITHRPFLMRFQNGAKFYTRLPGHDGAGVKGIHPVVLEVDEGQDINERTWAELPETVRWDIPGSMMLIHGVTNGVRNRFHQFSNSSKWTRHQFTRIHGSDWSPEEKAKVLDMYNGSENDPDYLRNVLGEPGATASRIFDLTRLERGRDDDLGSIYNSDEYMFRRITPAQIGDAMSRADRERMGESTKAQSEALLALCEFPDAHLVTYENGTFWAGMDVGLVQDPSEILVFVEYEPTKEQRRRDKAQGLSLPDEGLTLFKLLVRLSLQSVTDPLQQELVMALIEHYRPAAFSMDSTGIGLPMWQGLQQRAGKSELVTMAPPADATDAERLQFAVDQQKARSASTVIKGYNFSSKLLVDLDAAKLAELRERNPNPSVSEMIEEAGIYQNAKDRATDVLRSQIVDQRRHRLPADDDLIGQWNGQTMSTLKGGLDARGKRRGYSEGVFHTLDAGRMFALGWSQRRIERIAATARAEKSKAKAPVFDYL